MRKFINAIFIVLLFASPAFAQRGPGGPGGPAMMRIHAAKMAYITDRLQLSPRQYANFEPIYSNYEREVHDTRANFMGKYKGTHPDNTDDATSRRFIDDNLDYQQAIIDLKRKYNDRFLSVISPQQLADLYIAEREFRQILMKRLNPQQHPGGGGMYR